MVTFTPRKHLRISAIALTDKLGSPTIILLIIAIDRDVDIFVVNVQPYIEFLFVSFCHRFTFLLNH